MRTITILKHLSHVQKHYTDQDLRADLCMCAQTRGAAGTRNRETVVTSQVIMTPRSGIPQALIIM